MLLRHVFLPRHSGINRATNAFVMQRIDLLAEQVPALQRRMLRASLWSGSSTGRDGIWQKS